MHKPAIVALAGGRINLNLAGFAVTGPHCKKDMAMTFINEAGYADHVSHRLQATRASMAAEAVDEVWIHSGLPLHAFLDDYEYPYRPNPHFAAWLPLTSHPGCLLRITSEDRPVLYFYQPVDYWHTPPAAPADWWARHFDVHVLQQPVDLSGLMPSGRAVLIAERQPAGLPSGVEWNSETLINRLHLDRTVKTEYEIECMVEANRIAIRGHRAAEQAFHAGASELEIHLAYCAAAGQVEAALPYGSIVGLNEHGATLHYQGKDIRAPAESRSFLIDAGADCNGYAADVTRTYSANGGVFGDMIHAMDAVQRELADAATAGTDYRELHLSAHRAIAGCLVDFDVLRIAPDEAVETGVSGHFFPHGLGHFIGTQVHDVAGLIADQHGTPIPRPDGHPFLRLTRVLEAGNVLTIEPGFYFIESLLAELRASEYASAVNWTLVDALKPYGGIRVEDDVVVLEQGVRNLTREAFDRPA